MDFNFEPLWWLEKIKIFDHGSNKSCTFYYNVGSMQKIIKFSYIMGHVWSQYQYPIQEITFKI